MRGDGGSSQQFMQLFGTEALGLHELPNLQAHPHECERVSYLQNLAGLSVSMSEYLNL